MHDFRFPLVSGARTSRCIVVTLTSHGRQCSASGVLWLPVPVFDGKGYQCYGATEDDDVRQHISQGDRSTFRLPCCAAGRTGVRLLSERIP